MSNEFKGRIIDINGVPTVRTELTEDEVRSIYRKLTEVDTDAEVLKAAQDAAENSEYSEITEQDIDPDEYDPNHIITVTPREVLANAFINMKLAAKQEDAEVLVDLVLEYAKDENIKVYDRLPEYTKHKVDVVSRNAIKRNNKNKRALSKEYVAKYFFDSFIADTAYKSTMDQINEETKKNMEEMSEDLAKTFNDTFGDMFSKIDEIRETDPEQADRIQKVKDAFDRSLNFSNSLIEFLHSDKPRNARRYARDYASEVYQFNKLVNTTAVKVPDIDALLDIISLNIPTLSKDRIKEFLVLFSRSVINLDFNEIENISYVYKMVDNIYKRKFINPAVEDEDFKKICSEIIKVCDEISIYKEIRQEPNKKGGKG